MTGPRTSEWFAAVAVLALLIFAIAIVKRAVAYGWLDPEQSRKAVHLALGLGCISFPVWFHHPLPVWVIALVAAAGLLGLRLARFGHGWSAALAGTLHGVGRVSFGELHFCLGVALTFSLGLASQADGGLVRYGIAIAILTLADAAGALGGTRWGRHTYISGDGKKSFEGSAIFFLATLACVAPPLIVLAQIDVPRALLIASILALLGMMAEGLADRGLDNLILPVGAYLVLGRLVVLEPGPLTGRLLALIALLALVISGARWSSLTGAALLGCALLAYTCAILGGWPIAIPPTIVFVAHLIQTRRHQLQTKFRHRLEAVISHAIPLLPWVALIALGLVSRKIAMVAVVFAMATQLTLLDASTRLWVPSMRPRPAVSLLKGWLGIALISSAFVIDLNTPAWNFAVLLASGASFSWGIVALWVYGKSESMNLADSDRIWMLKGILALLATLPAAGLMQWNPA